MLVDYARKKAKTEAYILCEYLAHYFKFRFFKNVSAIRDSVMESNIDIFSRQPEITKVERKSLVTEREVRH